MSVYEGEMSFERYRRFLEERIHLVSESKERVGSLRASCCCISSAAQAKVSSTVIPADDTLREASTITVVLVLVVVGSVP